MKGDNGRAAVEEALRHWPQAFGLALSLTRDRARAEDLCQEAYLRLLETRREIDTSRPLFAFLRRIIRNLHISETRRTVPANLDGGDDVPDRMQSPPPAIASRREAVATVRVALDRLRPEWRAALYLRDGMGLSYAEISEVTSMSTDVVRVTLHRARKRIRASLGPGFREEAHS